MKQIIQIDDELKKKISKLERESEVLCEKLKQTYQPQFNLKRKKLVIELLRSKNGKPSTDKDILEINYESFIEIGIEKAEEYFPNTIIPIWKCKSEWFQKIGYLTRNNIEQLEKLISFLVVEMLNDKEGE